MSERGREERGKEERKREQEGKGESFPFEQRKMQQLT